MNRERRVWGWSGTALQLAGAGLLASHLVEPRWAYVVMTFGALAWAVIAVEEEDRSLLALNLGYLVINAMGLVSWGAST